MRIRSCGSEVCSSDLTGQQAERYPLLEVEGAAVRQEPSEETDTAGTRGGQPLNDLKVSGVLSYDLDRSGRLANASEAARAETEERGVGKGCVRTCRSWV